MTTWRISLRACVVAMGICVGDSVAADVSRGEPTHSPRASASNPLQLTLAGCGKTLESVCFLG